MQKSVNENEYISCTVKIVILIHTFLYMLFDSNVQTFYVEEKQDFIKSSAFEYSFLYFDFIENCFAKWYLHSYFQSNQRMEDLFPPMDISSPISYQDKGKDWLVQNDMFISHSTEIIFTVLQCYNMKTAYIKVYTWMLQSLAVRGPNVRLKLRERRVSCNIQTYACMHVCMHVCMHICIYVRMHVSMCVRLHVSTCKHPCIYIYMYQFCI